MPYVILPNQLICLPQLLVSCGEATQKKLLLYDLARKLELEQHPWFYRGSGVQMVYIIAAS